MTSRMSHLDGVFNQVHMFYVESVESILDLILYQPLG